jgi:multimeric flavodoxin WrbA
MAEIMKVISIIGSPKGMTGYTGSVVGSIMEGARSAGAETEIFSLSEFSVHPCRGCLTCSKTGRCVIDDDYSSIKNAMIEADGIILATPNYVHSVSAQMKALLDRSYSLIHCQMMRGKYGAIAVTTGGSEFEMVKQYLYHVMTILGCWRVGCICAAKPQLDDEDERAQVMKSASDLGVRMVKAISGRETFPDQEKKRQEYFEQIKWLVQLQKEVWPFEYEYWQTHWGLDETL